MLPLYHRPLFAVTRPNFQSIFASGLLHSRRFYSPSTTLALARWQINTQINRFSVLKAIGAVGLGLGISLFARPPIYCEGSRPPSPAAPPPQAPNDELPPPPASSVNVYELSFGTVAGICAGVFIKKGAKAIAFFLGGIFVLLQYFGSFGVLKVDWESMGTRFQRLFYTTDPETGSRATPTIYSAWRWLVDFLTADFQPRASFIAGLALGLRIG
ncbi:FUN14 family-domain-containing protein [Mycena galericulata]|nr:FUN14 family-domain-containing protein [Mycena galericulata]KAJ7489813.1 FUN14 family-domain-containing protein [Mycena galericulata]